MADLSGETMGRDAQLRHIADKRLDRKRLLEDIEVADSEIQNLTTDYLAATGECIKVPFDLVGPMESSRLWRLEEVLAKDIKEVTLEPLEIEILFPNRKATIYYEGNKAVFVIANIAGVGHFVLYKARPLPTVEELEFLVSVRKKYSDIRSSTLNTLPMLPVMFGVAMLIVRYGDNIVALEKIYGENGIIGLLILAISIVGGGSGLLIGNSIQKVRRWNTHRTMRAQCEKEFPAALRLFDTLKLK